jgi:hypothetical protein
MAGKTATTALQAAEDPLTALQLEIARKADAMVHERGRGAERDLHFWLLAEAEILGRENVDTLSDPGS